MRVLAHFHARSDDLALEKKILLPGRNISPNSGFFFFFPELRRSSEIVTGNFFRSQITTDKIILLLYVRCLYWQDD